MVCPRYYFYRRILGWAENDESNHLIFGGAIHRALEVLYKNLGDWNAVVIGEAYIAFLDYYRQYFAEDTDQLFETKNPNTALMALSNYTKYYASDAKKYKVAFTEAAGKIHISIADIAHFRLDTVLEGDGGYWVLEHKTASRFGRMWEEQWELNMQIKMYTHALCSIFDIEKAKGVIVNGIAFQKKSIEFLRLPVRTNLSMMDAWLLEVQYWVSCMRKDLERLGDHSQDAQSMDCFHMNTENCTKYFGCPYHDLCMSWANPLQKINLVPIGFKVDWWDPSNYDKEKVKGIELLNKR